MDESRNLIIFFVIMRRKRKRRRRRGKRRKKEIMIHTYAKTTIQIIRTIK